MAGSSRATYGALAITTARAGDDHVLSDFGLTNTSQFEYLSESLTMVQAHGGGQGIRDTRSLDSSRVRILSETISGQITLEPTPTELSLLLELAMGTAAAPNYTLADVVPEFGVLVDRVANRHVYSNCKVNRFTISGSQGQPIQVQLDVEGHNETEDNTAFPVAPGAINAIDSGQPYIFADTTFSLSADPNAAEVSQFSISIDNSLDTGRFMNSVTRECLDETNRIVNVSMQIPYTADTVDLHDQTVAGAAGSLTLTNSPSSTVFNFTNIKSPARTPNTSRRGDEIFLDLNMQVYSTASNNELNVVHTVS